MQSLRSAAELLVRADSVANLAPLVAAAGCGGEPAPLDADTRRALGLGADVLDARVAAGPGALRALTLEVSGARPLRETLPNLAARLSTRAPHVLWFVAAVHRDSGEIALTAWRDDRRPPRIAALLAHRDRLVDSDAETVAALCRVRPEDDLLTHSRWVDVLGREALTRRFYLGLERAIDQLAESSSASTPERRAQLALLHASRLLFLSFIEAKGWLNGERDFLRARLDECTVLRRGFQRRVLLPLFFGTLNTPVRARSPVARAFGVVPFLNGGLFARSAIERGARDVVFSDAAYGTLLHDLFGHYRFTAREESSDWTEVAVDPEMLGRALETLMAARDRKGSGSYFTPHELVAHTTTAALGEWLGRLEPATARDLDSLALLDPACGSGAFLVHALEEIAAMRVRLGDGRPTSSIRRQVLTANIFGVDINPMAVWLCELRLWLSVVVDSEENDPATVVPLPNLDHNIVTGDALTGPDFAQVVSRHGETRALRELRQRYAVASGARKDSRRRRLVELEREHTLDTLERELEIVSARRRDLLAQARGHDLFGRRNRSTAAERDTALSLRRRAAELRAARCRVRDGGALPFSFPARFADVAARGGFDVIVGNPPWVRVHHVATTSRARFRRDYEVARTGGWRSGAMLAGAGHGFASQLDLAALFTERCLKLLRPGAVLALLLPAKLWRSLAGAGVRRLLLRDSELRELHDLSEAPASFDAAVYPSLIVAARRLTSEPDRHTPPIAVSLYSRGRGEVAWHAPAERLAFDDSPGAPWLALPPEVRRAFDRVREAGTPLAEVVGRPVLGVKCGCNEAFMIRVVAQAGDATRIRASDGRTGTVESRMLRPVVRGETARAWSIAVAQEQLLWTHDAAGAPLAKLPPLAREWLRPWRSRLANRADARRAERWWSLFRTEGARDDSPRVVWCDVGRAPRAAVLQAGSGVVPLNSCYCIRTRDVREAHALTALLNSPLATAWLNAIAEPARGGYRRYLGWTVALLPVPANWHAAVASLSILGERAACGHPPGAQELLEMALDAYGLARRDVAPLVAWCAS